MQIHPGEGHPLEFVDIDVSAIDAHADLIESIYAAERCGVVVRGALPTPLLDAAVARLSGDDLRWEAPNKGMYGGEIRTIGAAATPTFQFLRGPTPEFYQASAAEHADQVARIHAEDPTPIIQDRLSRLFGGRPAAPPTTGSGLAWRPFNHRALDPGVQIYTHHDNHYGLSVYADMPADLDRGGLLSWFITLQAPEGGGALIVYGLWGSDPNPPVLPTRFLDTATIEARFGRAELDLRAGDLIVFDAGRFVHRVSPVEGAIPRLTLGGFLTLARDRSRLAFWS